MAERQGEIKFPEERPDWEKPFFQLCSPKGQKALEDALRLYAPYTLEEIEKDPALRLRIAQEASPHLEEAVADFITFIKKNYLNSKGIVHADWGTIGSHFATAFRGKYPEALIPIPGCGEVAVFNELIERMYNYLATIMALKEQEHRKISKKVCVGRSRGGNIYEQVPIHKKFFQGIDIIENAASDEQRNQMLVSAPICGYFHAAKHAWIPMLQEQRNSFHNPEGLTARELKEDNDRIAKLLLKSVTREHGGTIIKSQTTLYGKDNPVAMQLAPMDPQTKMFHRVGVQVNYFPPDFAVTLIEEPKRQEDFRARLKSDAQKDCMFTVRGLPAGFIQRFTGEWNGQNLSPEALKLIAGELPSYELLRRDVLRYYTRLVCSNEALDEMYGDAFTPKGKKPRQQNLAAVTTTVSNPSIVTNRTYPYEDPRRIPLEKKLEIIRALKDRGMSAAVEMFTEEEEKDIDALDEQIVKNAQANAEENERYMREHQVQGHPYMLRLIKTGNREDGTFRVTSPHPSPRAIELARAAGNTLGTGVEFLTLGLVVKPEQLPQVLKDNGAATLDELLAMFPGEAYPCHQGWISRHTRGNPAIGTIEAVSAHCNTIATAEIPKQ